MAPYIGRSLKRFEDPRLLVGEGRFVDDMQLPDMLHAVVLRSPHAHARIVSIDAEPVRALPRVITVLTARELDGKVRDIPRRVIEDLDGIGARQAREPGVQRVAAVDDQVVARHEVRRGGREKHHRAEKVFGALDVAHRGQLSDPLPDDHGRRGVHRR